MKSKTFFRGAIIAFAVCTFMIGEVRSQDEQDLVEYLKAGQQDASKLIGAYMAPAIEGLSYGMNGGWFHTAKAHKSLGFDIGVSVNAVFIPSSKNYFDPNSLGLTVATPVGDRAPTIVGPKEVPEYTVDVNQDGTPDGSFDGPEGLDFKENFKVSGVVAPTAQIGIGVYKNTDIKFRYMPEVEAGKTKIKLIGFGLLHDIKQHIPGIKLLPFDLSLMGAFTRVDGSSGLDGNPDLPPANGDTRPQKIDYTMNAWLISALISKKISVVTFYGGIGYNTIKTTANITGSYVVEDIGTLNDPFNETFKNSSMRVTAGMRFKFGPIYLNTDYTLQEYQTLSVGLGVSVR